MRSALAAQEAARERQRSEEAQAALRLEFRHSANLDDQLEQTRQQLAAFQQQGQQQLPPLPPPALAAGPLPSGWIEQVDQQPGSATYGRTFFVDTATGHTQWERPAPKLPQRSEPQPQAPAIAPGQRLVTVPPGGRGGMRVMVPHADGSAGFDWFLVPEGLQAGMQFVGTPVGQEPQTALEATRPQEPDGVVPATGDDALVAATFGAEEALAQASRALDAGRHDQAIATLEEALTAFQNSQASEDALMARADVKQLIALLHRAEDAQAALESASPVAVAEREAKAAGFSAEQILTVQGRQPQPIDDPSALISALLETEVPSPRTTLGFSSSGAAQVQAPGGSRVALGFPIAAQAEVPSPSPIQAGTWSSLQVGGFAALPEAVHAGYLNKQQPTGLIRIWQRRYFVLTQDTLRYWENAEAAQRDFSRPSMTEVKGQVPCHQITSVQGGTAGGGGALGDLTDITVVAPVVSSGAVREPYKLRADTPAAAQKWISLLREAARVAAADHPAPSTDQVPVAASQSRQNQPQEQATLGRHSTGTLDAIRMVEEAEAKEMAGGLAHGDAFEAAELRRQVVSSMGFSEELVEQVQAERLFATGSTFATAEELVEAVLLAESTAGVGQADTYHRDHMGMQSNHADQVMLQPVAQHQLPEVHQVAALVPPQQGSQASPPSTFHTGHRVPGAPAEASRDASHDEARAYIISMGFDGTQADTALAAAAGDRDQAVDMLLSNAAPQ